MNPAAKAAFAVGVAVTTVSFIMPLQYLGHFSSVGATTQYAPSGSEFMAAGVFVLLLSIESSEWNVLRRSLLVGFGIVIGWVIMVLGHAGMVIGLCRDQSLAELVRWPPAWCVIEFYHWPQAWMELVYIHFMLETFVGACFGISAVAFACRARNDALQDILWWHVRFIIGWELFSCGVLPALMGHFPMRQIQILLCSTALSMVLLASPLARKLARRYGHRTASSEKQSTLL